MTMCPSEFEMTIIEEQRERVIDAIRTYRSYKHMLKTATRSESYALERGCNRWQKLAVIELIILQTMRLYRDHGKAIDKQRIRYDATQRARAISHRPSRVYTG